MGRQRKIKRRNCDPVMAHNRAVKAGRSRTGTDYHLRKLTEAAKTLTAEQKWQLAALLATAMDASRDAGAEAA
jgi:hypothetical protein